MSRERTLLDLLKLIATIIWTILTFQRQKRQKQLRMPNRAFHHQPFSHALVRQNQADQNQPPLDKVKLLIQ